MRKYLPFRKSAFHRGKKDEDWKYSKDAEKLRYCDLCEKPLKKSEAHICKKCYAELISDAETLDKEEQQQPNGNDDDNGDET